MVLIDFTDERFSIKNLNWDKSPQLFGFSNLTAKLNISFDEHICTRNVIICFNGFHQNKIYVFRTTSNNPPIQIVYLLLLRI